MNALIILATALASTAPTPRALPFATGSYSGAGVDEDTAGNDGTYTVTYQIGVNTLDVHYNLAPNFTEDFHFVLTPTQNGFFTFTIEGTEGPREGLGYCIGSVCHFSGNLGFEQTMAFVEGRLHTVGSKPLQDEVTILAFDEVLARH